MGKVTDSSKTDRLSASILQAIMVGVPELSERSESMDLTKLELARFDRQMRISGWGVEGQKRLKSTRVAVAGLGGLGCPASIYLTAAGFGEIVLIDMGRFELSNLNRQILGSHKDIGKLKVEVAREKLRALNPNAKVEAVPAEINDGNVQGLVGDVDLIIDGQDNWMTRFVLNEYCVKRKTPFIHAGVSAFRGQMTTILPGEGPCLRCIIPKDPPSVEEIPILGATPALFATLQVMEAVKLVVGLGSTLVGKMLFASGDEMVFEIVKVERRGDCPICGKYK